VIVPATLTLPLITALDALIAPTVMFGVPERPVAFPVTLPVKDPKKVVAVITPVELTFLTVIPVECKSEVPTPCKFLRS
jgi:hypothetical protein